ncbi:NAD(P)H-dependent oxidoreductase [Limosilactobacillus fermentum]|jgi:multimeric flavodoxin WrbA|uniref:flavodoxin family protein n=1 Tax=Limosilactobacillus fermentum TaxID=1613 RepID=UPI0009B7AB2D|nr:NAD(P)H-dependent oxidoreductase [Limosilactobacillus fermentum]ARB00747.1 hypothetical protein B5C32_05015 [Limosilactobacillus fermentum]AZI18486.1 NAD(P)H dehydrogenase [Limosilactobacillus fermentum]KAB1954905.1 NAD(P)H-dependent oxidoreductase [Limosilactobacillus fermentum]MCT3430140.1 NAD(P)H dehydrogenase [Limosilactobacillus fermentum]MCT3439650.1 NAD(P)H dehydrogenase [Limosilactobacillus fermentum]
MMDLTSANRILFINASEHSHGTTTRLGHRLLAGKDVTQLDLIDYHLNQLGQHLPGDQLPAIIERIDQVDTIVIGIPIYWHMISAIAKTLFERLFWDGGQHLRGKQLGVFIHGMEPSDAIENTQILVRRYTEVECMISLGVDVL